VRVTTEALVPVATATDLSEPELVVPESALESLSPGSRLLWQVQTRRPDGERRDSETFITLLQ
jgi:hypothetical protein